MAANGHRHLATPSHIRPRNACSDGTFSLVWHHLATPRLRLILEQVLSAANSQIMIFIAPEAMLAGDNAAHGADTEILHSPKWTGRRS